MKQLITTCLMLFSVLVCTAQGKQFKDLIGTWEAVDDVNSSGGLHIEDSINIYLVFGDEKKRVVSFKADFNKSPSRFDFTLKNGTEDMHLSSLIQFINDDLIQWQVFEGEVQPAHFKENDGNMVYLRRKK